MSNPETKITLVLLMPYTVKVLLWIITCKILFRDVKNQLIDYNGVQMVNSKPNKISVHQACDEQLLYFQASLQQFAPPEQATGDKPSCLINIRVHI
jgi:hypothetical protein